MKKIYTVALLLALSTVSHAQISKGKDFWFSLMQNLIEDTMAAYITTDVPTTGVISIPGQGWSQNFTASPGVSTRIILPINLAVDITSNAVTHQAIHVVSTECVSVFAYNGGDATADATIVYPVNSIGQDYVVNSYRENYMLSNNPETSEFVVVGNYPNTIVSITPNVTTAGHAAGTPYNITLDSGDTYLLQNSAADLTGTRVTAANGQFFSVFSGNVCVNVNNACCCDHIYEQMAPIPNLGTQYITVPYGVPQPDKFRILSIQNGTTVYRNGSLLTNLNAGQYYDYNSTTVDYVTSTNSVSIVQLMGSGQSGGGGTSDGDPFMICVNPCTQRINAITFPTMDFISLATNYYWYVNVVAITSDVPTITMDGAALPAGTFTPVPSFNTYSTAHIRLPFGDHHLQSTQGVIGYVYGYTDAYESFGYQAGVLVQIPHLSIYDSTKSYCPNDTIPIALNSPDSSRITSIQWDLGDGSPHLFDTLRFNHAYANYGTYPVTIIYELQGACEPDTVTIDTIKVLGPAPDIGGPYDFCTPQQLTIHATAKIIPDTLYWKIGSTSLITIYPDDSITFMANKDTVVTVMITSNICPGYDTAQVLVGSDTAGFTYANACDSTPVAFTNTSHIATGLAYTWLWKFGDGSTSAVASPTHLYATGGTYTVTLKLTSPAGCTDSIMHQVTIYAKPHAAFTAGNVCNDSVLTTVNTSTISTGTMTYSWSFGDNSALVTTQSPSHTYAQSGAYTVSLTANSGPGCTDTVSHVSNIVLPVNVHFSATNVCFGQPSTFTDVTVNTTGSTAQAYTWNFGDGGTSTSDDTTHTYAAAGNYIVTFKINYGNNCYDSAQKTVAVNPIPVAAFTVNDLCNTGTTTPVNTSTIATGTMAYSWTFGDNTSAVTTQSPTHTYAQSGAYTIQLIALSDSGCSDTASEPINVIRGTLINFTAPAVCAGFTSVFTDQTTNPYNTTITGYNWTFGDGATSTQQNTTHTYATAGSYTVQLQLTYSATCADSLSKQVVVNNNPVAAFTVADLCNDSVARPQNTSTIATGSLTYAWSFGDNTAVVSGQTPTHTYAQSGNYTIQLIAISDSACSDTVTNPITVVRGTLINFTAPPVCIGFTSVFTDATANPYNTTITNYNWSFGDGTSASQQNTTHTYTAANTYTVQLQLTYSATCADSLTKQVIVYPGPVAAFTNTTPCIGNPTQFSDASTPTGQISAFNWAFGDGAVSALQNPAHTYASPGNYTVQQIITSVNGCNDTLVQQDSVRGKGKAQFTAPNVCLNDSTPFTNTTTNIATYPVSNYSWTFGDGSPVNTQTSPTYTYVASGNYNVTLVVDFADGCADTATSAITVYVLPTVSSILNRVSCYSGADGSIVLTPAAGQQPFSYAWNNNETGSTDSLLTMGVYKVTFTDAHQCSASSSFNIPQPTLLVLDTTVTPIICYGYNDGAITATVTGATPPYVFEWSNGNNTNTISKLAPGTYSVTVTDSSGCTATQTVVLLQTPQYLIQVDSVLTINLGESIVLNATPLNGIDSLWEWTPAEFLSCTTCEKPTAQPYTTFTYTVQSTSNKGCEAENTVLINVIPTYTIYTPNVFSPNGDGNNDYFEVYGNKQEWKYFEVEVFDRWGEKVFESTDADFKWDGTFKGKPLTPAVFVYQIHLTYIDNHTDKLYKGTVTLLR